VNLAEQEVGTAISTSGMWAIPTITAVNPPGGAAITMSIQNIDVFFLVVSPKSERDVRPVPAPLLYVVSPLLHQVLILQLRVHPITLDGIQL
jgi:hypothetical protein